MLIALTRGVSSSLAACELSHLPRVAIDVERARAQHRLYERTLEEAGCGVWQLPAGDEMPDSVFVEDIAVVFDEVAVITRPGAASRRAESPAVASELGRHRPLRFIEAPATLDGGDVLVVGRHVFVGQSSRTSESGIEQLRAILGGHGYAVAGVPVTGCLHLKSAVTAVGDQLLLMNRDWVSPDAFGGFEIVDVHPDEPWAANALRVAGDVVYPTAFPRTREALARCGVRLRTVDVSELAKAEGAVTCCSIIVDTDRI